MTRARHAAPEEPTFLPDEPSVPPGLTAAYRGLNGFQVSAPPGPRLCILATLGGLVLPLGAAVLTAMLAAPRGIPAGPAGAVGTVFVLLEAVLVGAGVAFGVERLWHMAGLPARPSRFFPLRWIRLRLARRKADAILARLREYGADTSGESLEDLIVLAAQADGYDRHRPQRISRLAQELAQEAGLSPEEEEAARIAGLLLDLGMLAIPDAVREEPGPLDEQWASAVQDHPAIGADLLSPFVSPMVAGAVRYHHERVDGLGYPNGVPTDTLSVLARVLPVVDTYDALISNRPYRPGRSRQEAFEELEQVSGTQLDSVLVSALIALESRRGLAGLSGGAGMVATVRRRSAHGLRQSSAPAVALVSLLILALASLAGLLPGGSGPTELAAGSYRIPPVLTAPQPSPSPPEPSPGDLTGEVPTDTVTPSPTDSPTPAPSPTDSPTPAPSPTDPGGVLQPAYSPPPRRRPPPPDPSPSRRPRPQPSPTGSKSPSPPTTPTSRPSPKVTPSRLVAGPTG
ncbi:MAG: hypothetical protein NVSMB32_09430 [Actinomycetota bacterium]